MVLRDIWALERDKKRRIVYDLVTVLRDIWALDRDKKKKLSRNRVIKQLLIQIHYMMSCFFVCVQGAAFLMVLRGTEKTVIDRKKVAYVFWSIFLS